MISGSKPRIVRAYLLSTPSGQQTLNWEYPALGQQFVGIPYGYNTDNSSPYIEIRDSKKNVVRTVNALDCCEIEFEPPDKETARHARWAPYNVTQHGPHTE
jgi:hypothetical protein